VAAKIYIGSTPYITRVPFPFKGDRENQEISAEKKLDVSLRSVFSNHVCPSLLLGSPIPLTPYPTMAIALANRKGDKIGRTNQNKIEANTIG